MSDKAHARRSDPQTSHLAADAVTLHLPALQALVETYAKRQAGGFCDRNLVEDHPDHAESSLRTRRSELTKRNIILDSGERRRIGGGNQHIVWLHRDFFADPPPIELEPPPLPIKEASSYTPPGPPAHLKQSAIDMAQEFEGYARSSRAEGRAFLADRMEANVRLLRALAS